MDPVRRRIPKVTTATRRGHVKCMSACARQRARPDRRRGLSATCHASVGQLQHLTNGTNLLKNHSTYKICSTNTKTRPTANKNTIHRPTIGKLVRWTCIWHISSSSSFASGQVLTLSSYKYTFLANTLEQGKSVVPWHPYIGAKHVGWDWRSSRQRHRFLVWLVQPFEPVSGVPSPLQHREVWGSNPPSPTLLALFSHPSWRPHVLSQSRLVPSPAKPVPN